MEAITPVSLLLPLLPTPAAPLTAGLAPDPADRSGLGLLDTGSATRSPLRLLTPDDVGEQPDVPRRPRDGLDRSSTGPVVSRAPGPDALAPVIDPLLTSVIDAAPAPLAAAPFAPAPPSASTPAPISFPRPTAFPPSAPFAAAIPSPPTVPSSSAGSTPLGLAFPPSPAPVDADGVRPMTMGTSSDLSSPATNSGGSSCGDPLLDHTGGYCIPNSGGGFTCFTPSGDCPSGESGDDDDDDTGPDDHVINIDDAISGGWGRSHMAEEVPVGALMTFGIDTNRIPGADTITSITWDGGTRYSEYFSSEATRQAEDRMRVKTEVKNNEGSYSFIVDPDDRTYTITVDVSFTGQGGDGQGHGEFTFDSIRPDVELEAFQGQAERLDKPDGTVQIEYVDDKDKTNEAPWFGWPEAAGMNIEAKVKTYDFKGDLMFLQVATPVRSATVVYPNPLTNKYDNLKAYHQGATDIRVIDNSFDFGGLRYNYGAYGYPIFGNDKASQQEQDKGERHRDDFNGWSMSVEDEEIHRMGDSPRTGVVPADVGRLVVAGSVVEAKDARGRTLRDENGNIIYVGTPEKFDTYVMYKPESGVWVRASAH